MTQVPLNQPTTVDLSNVQGDAFPCFPKKREDFLFCQINHTGEFCKALSKLNITSGARVNTGREKIKAAKMQQPSSIVELPMVNVSFSALGLKKLGIKHLPSAPGDPFEAGQLADAKALGDAGVDGPKGDFVPDWESAFLNPVHCVFLVAAGSRKCVDDEVDRIKSLFGACILVVDRMRGTVRPGDQKGHEHFGWLDGISEPTFEQDDVQPPWPGQLVVRPGVILCGHAGDEHASDRPEWAFEGSFLCFRKLQQFVPEFHKFLVDNPEPTIPDRTQGSAVLGAKLFGRWPGGASIIQKTWNDKVFGKNPKVNNNFDFPKPDGDEGQAVCPYAAHIRKTRPRSDIPPDANEQHAILRAGIPYGPEVSPEEQEEQRTEFSRGLAFVCYQSSIAKGFSFMQKKWANKQDFVKVEGVTPGFDPIIGQNNGKPRNTLGTKAGPQKQLPQDFVSSRGGEYFFSPSIKALRTVFAPAGN